MYNVEFDNVSRAAINFLSFTWNFDSDSNKYLVDIVCV